MTRKQAENFARELAADLAIRFKLDNLVPHLDEKQTAHLATTLALLCLEHVKSVRGSEKTPLNLN